MPRVISFIVLLAIILLVGAVFFQVMAQFIVPLFLACVLLVVFQPLHAWILDRLPRHPRLAALTTTILILLLVLLPLTGLGWKAYIELYALLRPHIVTVESVEVDGTEAIIETPAEDTEKAKQEHPWFHQIAFDVRNRFKDLTGIEISDDTVKATVNSIPRLAAPWVLTGVQSVIGVLIGLAIVVLALYYFLADGPAMIRTAMYLSPLEEGYEKELLERFGDVSRAVVVATLLSAVVQGALAGLGYVFALPNSAPIFLLTALTMVTALVPFVGAFAVWICVCVWVYLYGGAERVVDGQVLRDGAPMTAIVLAIYCTIVVSGIDNVIKPLILHGQSKLHPLLALLSILGGVQVLGPVGILVGPMLVSFLQALLHMLRRELDKFSGVETLEETQLAMSVEMAPEAAQGTDLPAPPTTEQSSTDGRNAKESKASPAARKAASPRRPKRKRGR